MMIPAKKPSKGELRRTKGVDDIVSVMERYLKKWNMPADKAKEFVVSYMRELTEKAVSGEERIVLPHNLGYMQVLEHQYEGKEKAHLLKFGNLDYGLFWIKHPIFVHHKIKCSKDFAKQARDKKLAGVKYLTDYVDGDTYVN